LVYVLAERDDKTRCIEGDMRITSLLTQIRATNVGDPVTRGGIAKTLKWKSNIIPYVFDELMSKYDSIIDLFSLSPVLASSFCFGNYGSGIRGPAYLGVAVN